MSAVRSPFSFWKLPHFLLRTKAKNTFVICLREDFNRSVIQNYKLFRNEQTLTRGYCTKKAYLMVRYALVTKGSGAYKTKVKIVKNQIQNLEFKIREVNEDREVREISEYATEIHLLRKNSLNSLNSQNSQNSKPPKNKIGLIATIKPILFDYIISSTLWGFLPLAARLAFLAAWRSR